ncbi:MAG: non-hydrolyzing UDP-N-acetylglucosamine 2-epimerase [Actinomycetota bacterium]
MKVLSVFGTRPEAIKMAPVVRELERHPAHIESRVCVTGQHRTMLDQVLDLFGITPDHDLDVMRDGQSPTQVAARVMASLEPILKVERPDWILVQGDTTTVTAAALAAFYARVRVGHVEAGLRSFELHNPFPEEMNRRLATVMADLHFAPTEGALENLIFEGVPFERTLVTGNTVIDALQQVAAMDYHPAGGPLAGLSWNKRLVLVTSHRRENHGAPLESICRAVLDIAATQPDVEVAFTIHPNPTVRETVYPLLSGVPNIRLLPPLEYLPLVHLLTRCDLVLTDSGGLQEEAPSLGKPVLVLRDNTERPEAVKAGTVRLVGTERAAIRSAALELLRDEDSYRRMARAVNPYGDGHASPRIVEALLRSSAEMSSAPAAAPRQATAPHVTI